MIKRVRQAKEAAANSAAEAMTTNLRKSALDHGWAPDVVANLSVRHSGGKFDVHVSPEYRDRAYVHEFGSESQRPTAAIRKFSHDTKNVQGIFMQKMQSEYGGKR